ncbi:uncharacterized protein EV422DRAFT_48997 [Fimicolochytrium jonesii]|uniref:uncharacterized protein n=1 Tax=Fimicolochytrium jonesii TaxID=1396493 RepID=UPI0022FED8C5|nr:uncharacterized protein EV422DRAFT_48997 [Fimicolochytrium jonesii]KAI8821000.1 hypothetical protein EV422DRAFT_48997 [Fimicolochytrium jonesii]
MSTDVECPVCHKNIPQSTINHHLDAGCLTDTNGNNGRDSFSSAPSSQRKLQTTLLGQRGETSLARPTNRSTLSTPTPKRKRGDSDSFPILEKLPSRPTSELPPTPTANGVNEPGTRREKQNSHVPLADLARPASLDDVQGHTNLIGPGTLLRSLIENNRVPSLILWGPPGSGKTTLARIIARTQNTHFRELSATIHNVADVRKAAEEAKNHRLLTGRKSVIFLDEIHRFTKSQQDFFLPPVEKGEFTLIAATTENPSFRVNNALLSRCRVFVLGKLETDDLVKVLRRALSFKVTDGSVSVADKVLTHLATICDGDARAAINALEMAVNSATLGRSERIPGGEGEDRGAQKVEISEKSILEALQKSSLMYDRNGDEHYNIISALHKSLRGSDENAALYWLGRMIYAGEDPLYVARRLIRFASEDIGLADSNALPLAVATYQSCQMIGMPECDAILAHCCVYMSRAPKSVEVYKAIKRVKQTIEKTTAYPVPLHIRNAPTKLMKELDYGKGYKYNPNYAGPVQQTYLPPELQGTNFFVEDEKLVDVDVAETVADDATHVMPGSGSGDILAMEPDLEHLMDASA